MSGRIPQYKTNSIEARLHDFFSPAPEGRRDDELRCWKNDRAPAQAGALDEARKHGDKPANAPAFAGARKIR
jgi:hypothetical protein